MIDLSTLKDVAEIAGVLATIVGGAYRLGRQDRELLWQSRTLRSMARKTGSVPPPRGTLPTLTETKESDKQP